MKKLLLLGLVALVAMASQSYGLGTTARFYNVNVSGDMSMQYASVPPAIAYIVKQNITTASFQRDGYWYNLIGVFPPIAIGKTVLVYDTLFSCLSLVAKDDTTPGYLKGTWLCDLAFIDLPQTWVIGNPMDYWYNGFWGTIDDAQAYYNYYRFGATPSYVVAYANGARMWINNGLADYPSALRFSGGFDDGFGVTPSPMVGTGPMWGRIEGTVAMTWGDILPAELKTFKLSASTTAGQYYPATIATWGVFSAKITTGSEFKF